MDVVVELKSQYAKLSVTDRAAVQARLEHAVKAYCGVSAQVRIADMGAVERSIGKAKRVIDRRVKA